MEKYEVIDFANDKGFICYQNKLHPLSEQAKAALGMLVSVFDDEVCLVIVGDRTSIALYPEEFDTMEAIENCVEESINKVLGNHPDFETISCSDADGKDYDVVMMQERALYIEPNNTGKKIGLAEAIVGRQYILDDCEEGYISGFVLAKGDLAKTK